MATSTAIEEPLDDYSFLMTMAHTSAKRCCCLYWIVDVKHSGLSRLHKIVFIGQFSSRDIFVYI